MKGDIEVFNLKREVAQLKSVVNTLLSEVKVLNKKLDNQRFINEQVSNNIKRVAAATRR